MPSEERGLYAMASLLCYVDAILEDEENPADAIVFEKEDLDRLWKLAMNIEPICEEEASEALLCSLVDGHCDREALTWLKSRLESAWQTVSNRIHAAANKAEGCCSRSATLKDGDDPLASHFLKYELSRHALPAGHPFLSSLNSLFAGDKNPLACTAAFQEAGFIILSHQPASYVIVAKHPLLPDHLVKVYFDDEKRKKGGRPGWQWLLKRCQGAEKIRKLIKEKNIKHFSVPQKWLYISQEKAAKIILVVTDMHVASDEASREAWQKEITAEHLEELYCILSHGLASTYLPYNIPYSDRGKFTCIDTEYSKRKFNYGNVLPYLSPEMQHRWNRIVRSAGS